MPRVKRGVNHVKKRNRLMAKVKGYKWGRNNLLVAAKEAVVKAGAHAFMDRRKKKRTNRALWQIKIGAFVREKGLSYSRFIAALKANNIGLDRKILSDFAVNNKVILDKIVQEVAVAKK
ncbi:TPA: 50S ribosomal protein L20 [Candidatus Falkowbacteria bacterium]|nr:50S ribosomal protein L20 [Candidatus Falkowbacteria bacterium]HAY11826.1 50S ribosomal protein L20 [Candidatus Falkowbacteria bacterium]HBI97049.1 50S ribosomal protein L20 [Candidatus Falkowbacteria bacterium]HBT27495.1 50S ribosomal protein L20 [Candidatus Falkowbacteria bacterium]HBY14883.1 50S ribosomal protein L20 [Candidatus Falkowbacteria bacterium]